MGRHDRGDDGDFKLHAAIADALRLRGFEQELHWVLRQHVSDAPSIDPGTDNPQGAQDAPPHEGPSGQRARGQRDEGAARPGQPSGKKKPAGAEQKDEDDDARANEATRKAKQRRRAEDAGWKEITVKAPKTQDARELVAEFARMIFEPEVRSIMRLAVSRPELVRIGQKVDGLNGLRRILVHWLLG